MTHCTKRIWSERQGNNNRRPDEIRSEYERDLSRLIHSSAFRRLQSKTQVLGLGESDFYRTRLTHSMEVAQIGTGILSQLNKRYESGKSDAAEFLPEQNLMQAICLAHDIGHPPFGHGGEVALNYCMRAHGGFEGNGQTLRILTRLDKYTESNGLDPTRRLILGVLKYPGSYSEVVNESAYGQPQAGSHEWLFKSSRFKPPKCYLDSEIDIVEFALLPFDDEDTALFKSGNENVSPDKHSKTKYKALDTTIMDLADEISYSLHDLEDAISLRMIDRNMWMDHFRDKECLFEACHRSSFELTADAVADRLFGKSYLRKECIGTLVHLMITSVTIQVQHHDFKCGMLRYKAVLPEEVDILRKAIFELVEDKVIRHENVQLLEFKGQKLIVELFNVLASDPERFLPLETRNTYIKEAEKGEDQKMRVISDYVAGMTDDYATRLYEKIFVPGKGSIFDRL
jgi:dGTPase